VRLSAVILAGGRSRRMGRDKALLPVSGHATALERQLALIAVAKPLEVLISCRPGQRLPHPAGTRRVHDDGSKGPLAGVAAAMGAARGDALLVLGIDLVRMTPHLLRRILGSVTRSGAAGVIPRVGGHAEPLASVLPRALAAQAVRQIEGGDLSLQTLARHAVAENLARWFDVPDYEAHAFANWNHRSDVVPPVRGSA